MRFDLDAYLRRIHVSEETKVDAGYLRALHLAHLSAIPFENLDVRLGRPISLDPDALMDKLVRRRRGGYCFEHNTLFSCILRELGVRVETLEARVRPPGAQAVLPRTHMALRIVFPDRSWMADVGFGGDGPLWPVPWDGEESRQPDALYRLTTDPDGGRVLQRKDGDSFRDLYSLLPTPALPVDFEVANHFTATHHNETKPFLPSHPHRSYPRRRGDEGRHRRAGPRVGALDVRARRDRLGDPGGSRRPGATEPRDA